jgi:glycosyltransferase involved in cell wall biosynthesis
MQSLLYYNLSNRYIGMGKNNFKIDKVLFLVPSPKSKGGISNYYSVIQDSIQFPFEYFYRGVRKQQSRLNRPFSLFIIVFDYIKFYFKIRKGNYHPVILNTSFGKTGFWRDYLFIRIIRLFRIKHIVFFRGIDYTVLDFICEKRFNFFRNTFLQADSIIVLSDELKQRLIQLGYKRSIYIETTVVDSQILKGVSNRTITKRLSSTNFKILFLSRIEKSKGIYELLEAFQMIHKKYPQTSLHICGEGKELNAIKRQISMTESVCFRGFVENENKILEYTDAQLFILPSYHEGLPNTVVEAMAFGLPVITTPVGGITDVFTDGVNGILLKEHNPATIYSAMEQYILDLNLRISTGLLNFNYAKEKFYKEIVVERLTRIISTIEREL